MEFEGEKKFSRGGMTVQFITILEPTRDCASTAQLGSRDC